jgi:hypothetical protein
MLTAVLVDRLDFATFRPSSATVTRIKTSVGTRINPRDLRQSSQIFPINFNPMQFLTKYSWLARFSAFKGTDLGDI